MLSAIEVSAPGKLFLVGEYAVLEGAPALLTAVGRRARVGITRSTDDCWRFDAPDLGLVDVQLGPFGTLTHTLDADTRSKLRVFDAVRSTVAKRLDQSLPPLAVRIDTRDFTHAGHKLGLGSSAAVAAALTQALSAIAGQTLSRAELTARAIKAHRKAQNGTGSGGDVAASVYGGFISYINGAMPVPLAWPDSLAGLVVVTGTGAQTVDMVKRVRNYALADPDGYNADISRLCGLADTAQHKLARRERFLQLTADYFNALMTLDRHAQAGIVTRRHHELYALARVHNGVFKTSGAGGGDVGLAFVRRGEDEAGLRRALIRGGAEIVPLEFGAPGVAIETSRR